MEEDANRRGFVARPPPSDELLRLVFESATDFAITSIDEDGRVTSWNVGAERLLGYTESEMVGRDGDVIFTPEDRAAGVPVKERSVAAAAGRAEDERWHMRKDGSRFWASGILMPLADETRGFVKILRDLTRRRRAQERLESSEALFRALATNIPQLVFRTRANGERTWDSPQWVVFTGVSVDDSMGLGWLDAVHPEDRQPTLDGWRDATSTGRYDVQHRIRRAEDDEYRWHRTRANPLGTLLQTDAEWVGTSTDVHDMRTLQEQQNVLLAELQHRTRNLLGLVHSIARQTIRTNASLDEFADEFEGRLHALSRVLGLLVQSEWSCVDLGAILEAELAAYGHIAGQEPRFTLQGPPALLPATSAQALGLAIHELATNAVKYGAFQSPSGHLDVAWHIEHQQRPEPVVVLEWRESGVKIDPAASPRIGYGRELIERALPFQLGARTHFAVTDDGVHCRIETKVNPSSEHTLGN